MARKDITPAQVVQACQDRQNGSDKNTVQLLMERTGQHENVAYAALYRDSDRGLIEYGTSIRGAWPTDKGLLLL
jgi:hypothetical protein